MSEPTPVENRCRVCDAVIPHGQVHCNIHRRGPPDSKTYTVGVGMTCPRCKGPMAPGSGRMCGHCLTVEKRRLAKGKLKAMAEEAERAQKDASRRGP